MSDWARTKRAREGNRNNDNNNNKTHTRDKNKEIGLNQNDFVRLTFYVFLFILISRRAFWLGMISSFSSYKICAKYDIYLVHSLTLIPVFHFLFFHFVFFVLWLVGCSGDCLIYSELHVLHTHILIGLVSISWCCAEKSDRFFSQIMNDI